MDEKVLSASRRRRMIWAVVAMAFVVAGAWIYLSQSGAAADRLRRRALNDSLHSRAQALVAQADSLMTAGDDIGDNAWFVGDDYLTAAALLDSARLTVAKADPALPDPVDSAKIRVLEVRLRAARDVVTRQLGLVEGMPKAEATLNERLEKINALLSENE